MTTGSEHHHQADDCIFCKIVSGIIPCFKLYEDEQKIAFLDINPVNPGHCLIVPKTHSSNLLETADSNLAAILPLAKLIASVVAEELQPDGINLHQANGPGAAQSVHHFHLHIVPRRMNDGVLLNWPLLPGDRDELKAMADRLRPLVQRRVAARGA